MPEPPAAADLADLLSRCRRREPAAQRALYGRFAGRLLGVARRYVRTQPEAEDILQDAFVKIFTRLDEFRAEGSLEGWMRRVVVTTALNYWQSGQGRRQQLQLDDVAEPPMPEADSLDRLNVAEVLALVDQLPEGCRMVLMLYAVDGYAHAEIAELLGIQASTSKAQLSRARKLLGQLYQKQNNFIRL